MSEAELLQRFRDDVPEPSTDAWVRARAALTAAKQETLVDNASFQPARPPRRLRLRPVRWLAAGLGVAGVAAATTLAFALTGVPRPIPNHGTGTTQPTQSTGTIRTVGFVLAANANGTLTLTMRQVLDPAALQQALAQHGIPALVKTDAYCTSNPAAPDPRSIGVLSANLPFKPPTLGLVPAPAQPLHPAGFTAGTKTVINPAAMPAGTELFFGYVPGDSLVSAGLIYTKSYSCSSQRPPAGPKSP
ncbi:MAG: hypothetical protein ACYDAQ_09920 [Mycobacteriales bacterium]